MLSSASFARINMSNSVPGVTAGSKLVVAVNTDEKSFRLNTLPLDTTRFPLALRKSRHSVSAVRVAALIPITSMSLQISTTSSPSETEIDTGLSEIGGLESHPPSANSSVPATRQLAPVRNPRCRIRALRIIAPEYQLPFMYAPVEGIAPFLFSRNHLLVARRLGLRAVGTKPAFRGNSSFWNSERSSQSIRAPSSQQYRDIRALFAARKTIDSCIQRIALVPTNHYLVADTERELIERLIESCPVPIETLLHRDFLAL